MGQCSCSSCYSVQASGGQVLPRAPAVGAAHAAPFLPYHSKLRCAVQVKRVVGAGEPSSSCVVQGVVFRKNVAHKRMRTSIPQAGVLLLAGALEWQPTESKLQQFDTLLNEVTCRALHRTYALYNWAWVQLVASLRCSAEPPLVPRAKVWLQGISIAFP